MSSSSGNEGGFMVAMGSPSGGFKEAGISGSSASFLSGWLFLGLGWASLAGKRVGEGARPPTRSLGAPGR
eukprot:13710812-Alexandrium_andersonii.AAC.1